MHFVRKGHLTKNSNSTFIYHILFFGSSGFTYPLHSKRGIHEKGGPPKHNHKIHACCFQKVPFNHHQLLTNRKAFSVLGVNKSILMEDAFKEEAKKGEPVLSLTSVTSFCICFLRITADFHLFFVLSFRVFFFVHH